MHFEELLIILFGFSFKFTLCIEVITNVTKMHSCERDCLLDKPMTCVYTLKVRNDVTLSTNCKSCPYNYEDCKHHECLIGNGVKRIVTVVNNQYPGPLISVCIGDTIVAEVRNRMLTESVLMHWHGMHQVESPYMDGMDFVTQLPTVQANSFRYIFEAYPQGTHLYHSHIAFQRMDGVVGPLIVKVPDVINPVKKLYHFDLSAHIIVIQDWYNIRGIDTFYFHTKGGREAYADAILVNGLGRFPFFDKKTNKTFFTKPAKFIVEKGYRYRMRLINAGVIWCPIEVSIDNHTITFISTDGYDFQPVRLKYLLTGPGETYDFIVDANQKSGTYWIKFKGNAKCINKNGRVNQVAVLQYSNSVNDLPENDPDFDAPLEKGKYFSPIFKSDISNEDIVEITDLISVNEEIDDVLKEEPDFVYFMRISNNVLKNDRFGQDVDIPQLDYISSSAGDYVLLPQRNLLNYSTFCNFSTTNNCQKQFCNCEHLVQFRLNDVVELIMVDEQNYSNDHSFHLHGYTIRVVAHQSLGRPTSVEEIQKLYYNGTIKKNLKAPPFKDTFRVPGFGYTIVRFKASNPGYWFFHCHMDIHMEMGMHCVFKIGENSDMKPVPDNFPVVARFLPEY